VQPGVSVCLSVCLSYRICLSICLYVYRMCLSGCVSVMSSTFASLASFSSLPPHHHLFHPSDHSQEYAEAEQFRAWRAEGRMPTKADIGMVNSVSRVCGR